MAEKQLIDAPAPAEPAAVAVPDERTAFEAVASDNGKWPKAIEHDSKGNYFLMGTASGWTWWQARAALATTQMPVCDSVQTEASSKPASTASEIAAAICQRVAELDDRNSPEGQPNMMLVTRGELHGFICEALATTPDADQAGCLKNFRAILNAEINRAIDPSGDIARQEAAIDTTDHLLAEFSKLFPEA